VLGHGRISALKLENAYIDGELCAVRPDGTTSFSAMQAASDGSGGMRLVNLAFDLLFVDGDSIAGLRLIERKEQLEKRLLGAPAGIRYSAIT
jgi:bifunctional non-homologous end joining protein LigD